MFKALQNHTIIQESKRAALERVMERYPSLFDMDLKPTWEWPSLDEPPPMRRPSRALNPPSPTFTDED